MDNDVKVTQEDVDEVLKLFDVTINYTTKVNHVVKADNEKDAWLKAVHQSPIDSTQAIRNLRREDPEYHEVEEIGLAHESPDGKNIVYLDLETKLSSDDVGGWYHDKMGVSVICTYQSGNGKYYSFEEKDVHQLISTLKVADLVVGFNLRDFDYRVLQAYSDFDFQSLPTWDMMTHIHMDLGYRVSLQNLAEGINREKSGDGMQAVEWFKAGEIDKVIEYCTDDVDITRELFMAGCNQGYLVYWNKKDEVFKRINTSHWKSAVSTMLKVKEICDEDES